ncbi:MAG: hypothetical protein IK999_05945 [Ruminococcus sp.]|nr:hypothetical protein [Ruminococcus sp.]
MQNVYRPFENGLSGKISDTAPVRHIQVSGVKKASLRGRYVRPLAMTSIRSIRAAAIKK